MPKLTHCTLCLICITTLTLGTGCDSSGSSGRPTSGFTSEVAFSIELTDPETGLMHHAGMEELMPVVLRELDRITQEPLLRQMLNKPVLQQTNWFKQFSNNLDDAYAALASRVIFAEYIEGTGMIKAYASTSEQADSQIILNVMRDEYMRLKSLAEDNAAERILRAAQGRRDDAEQRLTSVRVAIRRAQETSPDGEPIPDDLIKEKNAAEAERDLALTRLAEIKEVEQRGGGFLGYRVSEEYPPQKAR